MSSSDDPVVRYANNPALRAATSRNESSTALLVPGNSENYDIRIPASNDRSAREILTEVSRRWNDTAEGDTYKTLMWIPKSSAAGELYVQQVEVARTRFLESVASVGRDYVKVGKYTPAHVQRILDCRSALQKELSDIIPNLSFFRIISPGDVLESDKISQSLAHNLKATESLSGKTVHNLSRSSVRQGGLMSYADDLPVKVDLKLAKTLKSVNKVVQVMEFVPAASVLLSSDNPREQEKALAQLGAKASGLVIEQAISVYGPALCVAFTAGTLGLGFVSCGLISLGVGIYLGNSVEEMMKPILGPQNP